ncbi:MAG: amidophosphoribosyltransferase [Planctomycetota bacterium]|nr:amidophosphoribosyltransferase [Planctomycetota bacterium]
MSTPAFSLGLPVISEGRLQAVGRREWGEKCGVFGVWGAANPAHLTYVGLLALQHRGQESAGIASTDGRGLLRHASMGLVPQAFPGEVIGSLDAHANSRAGRDGALGGAIGHNRYSTTGASRVENAQPLMGFYRGGQMAVGHNGNVVNAAEIRRRLEDAGHAFQTTSDTEVVLQLVASRSQPGEGDALAAALSELRGAFSLVFLFEDRIEVARDPWGWRPLVLGEMPGGGLLAASETIALDIIGARFVREVEPGEIVTLSDAGIGSRRFAAASDPRAHCVFEHVYFASPASRVFGQTVQIVRERLGERLAREAPVQADLVLPMPDSGRSAATGYARASGLPYREGIIPNRYVGRTFIRPSSEERAMAARLKLHIVEEVVRGQRCVVVDDSIVRGTTTKAKMDQLRAAGAREIHLRISCPPIRHPCFFGVDFADPAQLIAAGREVEQIRAMLGVDSLHYLSLEGMLDVVQSRELGREHYCTACFSGAYPIEVPADTGKDVLTQKC